MDEFLEPEDSKPQEEEDYSFYNPSDNDNGDLLKALTDYNNDLNN